MINIPAPAPFAGKDGWRAWAKAVRKEGIPDHASAAVSEAIGAWLPSAREGTVVLYLPLPDELDITPIMENGDRSYALTRTPPDGPLTLHSSDGPRERHRYGFEQPTADAPIVDSSDVGVVLVPGLAFDRSGQRLGRGAGYYDTFLPSVALDVPRVAIVPSWLVIDWIPTEPHDLTMTHLATEHGVRSVPGQASR